MAARTQGTIVKDKIPTCESAEWQAEAFGSAIVMPIEGVLPIIEEVGYFPLTAMDIDFAVDRIVSKFHVTLSAATKRVKNLLDLYANGRILQIKKELH